MKKSQRHYTPTQSQDGEDEAFQKPLNEASKSSVSGLLDELLALADAGAVTEAGGGDKTSGQQ